MLTFKKFLEANVPYEQEHLALDELIKVIKDKCFEALNGQRIWRGSARAGKSGKYNPATGTRVSAGGIHNYYTVLLDTNQENAGWPKRSKSFICSTNKANADRYGTGTTYTVFPYDGSDIGQVNRVDLWNCPIKFSGNFKLNSTIYTMQELWEDLHRALKGDIKWTPTMKEAVDFYRKVDPRAFVKVLQNLYFYDRDATVSEEKAKEVLASFCEQLPEAYSYNSMGCTLETPKTVGKSTEVWFSGPCVLVTEDDWETVSEELGL